MFNINEYVLIDCGLIHKFLVKKDNIKKLEDETFYSVKVVNNLENYKVIIEDDKLEIGNGSDLLVFKKVDIDKYLKYMLDEF